MTRQLIDHTLWEMGQAFDALFANLKDLEDDDWTWLPPGGVRTIQAIVGHIASCKMMYEKHAFGAASLPGMDQRSNEPPSPPPGSAFEPAALVDWLRESDVQL